MAGAVRELVTLLKFRVDKRGLTDAKKQGEKLKDSLENLDKKKITPKVDVNASQAVSALDRVKAALSKLHDKRITITESKKTEGAFRKTSEKSFGKEFASEAAGGIGLPVGMSAGAMAGAAAVAGVVAVGAAAKKSVETFMDFDATMSKVRAITQATDEDMAQLSKQARNLGATTQFSATQAAEAMTYLGMAGWKTKDIMAGMPGLLDLAAASGEDLATVADIVSDDLTAFGMSADKAGHMADVMAAASTNANTNVSMMGYTFKYVGSLAGALKYSFEDMALATGMLANAGLKGEQAGTNLRGIISSLSDPKSTAAQRAVAELGLNIKNADGTIKPFRQTLQELRKAMSGLSDVKKLEYIQDIFNTENVSAVEALINTSEADFQKLANAVDNAEGAAHKFSQTANNNLKGDLKQLQSQVEETALTFGERLEPSVRTATNKIKNWLNGLTEDVNVLFKAMDGPQGNTPEELEKSRQEIEQMLDKHPAIKALFEDFSEWAEEKAPVLKEAIGDINAAWSAMEPVLQPLLNIIGKLLIEAIQALLGVALAVFGAIAEVINTAAWAANALYNSLVQLYDILKNVAEYLGIIESSKGINVSTSQRLFNEAVGNGGANINITQNNNVSGYTASDAATYTNNAGYNAWDLARSSTGAY